MKNESKNNAKDINNDTEKLLLSDVIKSVCIHCEKPQDEAWSPYCSFYCMSNHQMQTVL